MFAKADISSQSLRLRTALIRARIFLLARWYSFRKPFSSSLVVLVVGGGAFILHRHWVQLDAYLNTLEKPVIPELAIGIGAAITGIIAIAFSLSLFAIQQVADRGTPTTLQAYAKDRLMNLIYWALAAFAIVCFSIAFLKVQKNYQTGAAVAELLLLLGSFVLLRVHFKRAIMYADPRFTIARTYKRGQKQLKRLRHIRDIVVQQTQDENRRQT
jgi:uncharacterized membrane protein